MLIFMYKLLKVNWYHFLVGIFEFWGLKNKLYLELGFLTQKRDFLPKWGRREPFFNPQKRDFAQKTRFWAKMQFFTTSQKLESKRSFFRQKREKRDFQQKK
jgi:hypothetical protein